MDEIERIHVSEAGSGKYDEILQRLGAAGFRQTVQRNIEKDFIERQAALLSVAEQVSIIQPIGGLHTIQQATAGGGVKVAFPIDGRTGDTGKDTNNEPLVHKQVTLDRANVTYNILHEAVMEGGNLAENDAIAEGTEQLGAAMDNHYIVDLKDKKSDLNDVAAAATWATTGTPFDDINEAINNIIVNSAINPNAKSANWFTIIAPISTRVGLEKITIIDGLKTSLTELITARLGAKILYSRQPFNWDGPTWPIATEAIVVSTKDRHVGKFYTFDGGAMPSIFTETSENGKRVSTNSWMKHSVSPNEDDGNLDDNLRIGIISAVA